MKNPRYLIYTFIIAISFLSIGCDSNKAEKTSQLENTSSTPVLIGSEATVQATIAKPNTVVIVEFYSDT